VARETRRQRRDARRAAGGDDAARAPARRQPAEAVAGAPESVEPIRHEDRRRGGFIRESIAELKKVDWPNRSQVIQGTVVVLIACAVVGAFLYGADLVFRPFVRDVLLGV
jgi:preprotein translocase subunit SecE